jgi:thioredoxin reductase
VTHVAVIGAGPYGLSAAAHLRGKNVPHRVFGVPMLMWRQHMPEGMVLKSDAFASNLSAPGNEFPLERFYSENQQPYTPVGQRTPLDTLIAYGLEFQRRHVGRVEESQVVSVSRNGSRFQIDLDTGEQFQADKVVVASGLMAFQNCPISLSNLPTETWSHVSAHRDLSPFADKRVIVIGGGQSALETSALLREKGADVTIVTRRPVYWYDPANEAVKTDPWSRLRRPNFGLGPGWRTWFWSEAPAAFGYLSPKIRLAKAYTTFGPAGSGWLKHRVDGLIPIHTGTIRGVHARADEVHLSVHEGERTTQLAADHVIAATGYAPNIRRLSFLEPILPAIKCFDGGQREGGLPVLDRAFQSSVPGLHFVGAISATTFGPSMRFIYGTRFTAGRIAPSLTPSQTTRVASKLSRQPA